MVKDSVISAKNAAQQNFIPLMRELVRAYQAFASYDAAGYKASGLTSSQADVIFTLGNTEGMTFKQIGGKTLITKGTLTGVIDRLEHKDLVRRVVAQDDRRYTFVVLTAKGKRLFEHEFPRQIGYLKTRFERLSKTELKQTVQLLRRLREIF